MDYSSLNIPLLAAQSMVWGQIDGALRMAYVRSSAIVVLSLDYPRESTANPDCTASQPAVPERRPWRVPTRLRPTTWRSGLTHSTLRILATKRMN